MSSSLENETLALALTAASKASQKSLERVNFLARCYFRVLSQTADDLKSIQARFVQEASLEQDVDSAKLKTDFSKALVAIEASIQREESEYLKNLHALKEKFRFVTIMLFGRTKAGKSTLVEAFIRGDGSSKGIGAQHTTKVSKEYFFPKEAENDSSLAALRLVDTPGFDGFNGDALAKIAEDFIPQADHVFFAFSDDKQEFDELKRFRQVMAHKKGITVLLNVKSRREDLELLETYPEYIFKPEEIAGHKARIGGFFTENFSVEPPEILPIHSLAAYLGRSVAPLPEKCPDRKILLEQSGFNTLSNYIEQFIRQHALQSRIRAPYDLLSVSLKRIFAKLEKYQEKIAANERLFAELSNRKSKKIKKILDYGEKTLSIVSSAFKNTETGLEAFLEEALAGESKGNAKAFEAYLEKAGIVSAVEDWEAQLKKKVREEAKDFQISAKFDLKPTQMPDVDHFVKDYFTEKENQSWDGYKRAAIKTAGSVGTMALTGWAIANCWNPTGWVAGAAVLATEATVGFAGSAGAGALTEAWEAKSRERLRRQQTEIIEKLRHSIQAKEKEALKQCRDFLRLLEESAQRETQKTLMPAEKMCGMIIQKLEETLRKLRKEEREQAQDLQHLQKKLSDK